MKKFIQISSILSLLFVFAAVSAFAQSGRHFKAQIPFDFNIGENVYQSGNYGFKVVRNASGDLTLTVENSEGKPLEIIFVANTGSLSEGDSQIVFNRYGNQMFLSQVQTESLGVNLRVSKTEKTVSNQSKRDETVAIFPTK